MSVFIVKLLSLLRYPEILHSGPKNIVCIFYMRKVCEMLRNTPKHYFGSNGVEWVHSLRNHFRIFGTLKQCIQARNTSFASFHMPQVCKMLRSTPKHHFGSNGVEWVHSLRNYFCNFGTLNSVLKPETQVLPLFTCRRFAKCSGALPHIILPLMEQNGRIHCETIFVTSVP